MWVVFYIDNMPKIKDRVKDINDTVEGLFRAIREETDSFNNDCAKFIDLENKSDNPEIKNLAADYYLPHKEQLEKFVSIASKSKSLLKLQCFLFPSELANLKNSIMTHRQNINTAIKDRKDVEKSFDLLNLMASRAPHISLFSQDTLISAREYFLQEGICDGLLSEWSRFYSKEKNQNLSFTAKLQHKFEELETNFNNLYSSFSERIYRLHAKQQEHQERPKDVSYRNNMEGLNFRAVKNVEKISSTKEVVMENIINYFATQDANLAVVDYGVRSLNNYDRIAGHAVGIRCIRGENQSIDAYVFYDPNFGEITFTGSNKETELKHFFEQWANGMNKLFAADSDNTNPNIDITVEMESIKDRLEYVARIKETVVTKKQNNVLNTISQTNQSKETTEQIFIDEDSPTMRIN